jgi:hypothetical protein
VSTPDNVVQRVLTELELLAEPLLETGGVPRRLYELFARSGWDLQPVLSADPTPVITAADALRETVETASQAASFDDLEQVLDALGDLADAIDQLDDVVDAVTDLFSGAVDPAVAGALVEDLLQRLALEYLHRRAPLVLQLLRAVALIDEREAAVLRQGGATGDVLRFPFRRPELRLDRLGDLLTDPVGYFKAQVLPAGGVNTNADAAAAVRAVFGRLENLVVLLGGTVGIGLDRIPPSEAGDPALAAFERQATVAFPIGSSVRTDPDALKPVSLVGADFAVVPKSGTDFSGAPGPALELSPFGVVGVELPLPGWELELQAGGSAKVVLRKDGLSLAAAADRLLLRLALERASSDGPAVLVGSHEGSRLEIGRLRLSGFVELSQTGDDLGVLAELGSAVLAVVPGEGDGFLQKVLPPEGIRSDFELALGWSRRRGIYFKGSAGLEVEIPVHLSLAEVLRLESIFLAVRTDGTDLKAMVAASAGIKLGPIAAAVERIGLAASISFPESGGNLGPASVDELAFKPPDGAGIAVGAGPVKGGGYLFFDTANEQYAGVLQLDFKALSLKAIGLLTTRMPDGSKGFSLLIIITAEFPSIQLGFGFTLNGVGGLIGVNRTLVKEVLQAGVKTGALGSILFPKNPVENAPQLLSDLRTVFPPAPASFVIGPMAKLGWGTPTLITLELGIILQLPAPLRLFILGRLSMRLPTAEAAVLSLNLDVLGIIDFDEGEASVDASLYDSRLAGFTLTGDMAARLGWAKTPHFELAAGGWHPRFQPPAAFPKLDRLAISLAAGDNPRLRLECYFALTSNTLQFGAALDFHVHVDLSLLGLFSVDAHLGFDVLIRFSPFRIEADIAASLDLKRNGKSFLGVWLDLHLTGPGPWHAWGQATFEFFGRHSIGLDMTIGPAAPPPALPESKPIEALLAALSDPGNWSAQMPADGQAAVTLRELPPVKGRVLVHPLGELSVRQRVVPLKLVLQKFGATRPTGPLRFEITDVALGGVAADDRTESVREYFAPAQFLEMSDDEKLSRPGFEAFEAGKRIGSSGLDHPKGFETTFGYEDVVVDVEPNTGIRLRRQRAPKTYRPTDALLDALSSRAPADTDAAAGLGVAFDEPVYVVADLTDMNVSGAVGATAEAALTYTEASQMLDAYASDHPREAEAAGVVAAHEAVAT